MDVTGKRFAFAPTTTSLLAVRSPSISPPHRLAGAVALVCVFRAAILGLGLSIAPTPFASNDRRLSRSGIPTALGQTEKPVINADFFVRSSLFKFIGGGSQ